MVGTAVATTSAGGRGVFKLDLNKFDPKKMSARADMFARAVGGSTGSSARYPGEKYTYSKGNWFVGLGANKKPLKEGTVVVLNAIKGGANWVKWVDKRPTYHSPEMVMLASGDEMALREDLGDMDPDDWDVGADGNPIDPWKPNLVFPIRNEDDETINHIELTTKSATIAGFSLFKEICETLPMHTGEIPLVKLASKKVEMKRKVTNKKGVEVETKLVFDAPVFEVVGWTQMKQVDDPDAPVNEATGDVGDVSVRERAPATSTESVKKAKRQAKVVEADEEDDL